MSEIKHDSTNEIVCPHCGYQFGDSWELDEDGQTDCHSCDKPFNFVRHQIISYSTWKIGESR